MAWPRPLQLSTYDVLCKIMMFIVQNSDCSTEKLFLLHRACQCGCKAQPDAIAGGSAKRAALTEAGSGRSLQSCTAAHWQHGPFLNPALGSMEGQAVSIAC